VTPNREFERQFGGKIVLSGLRLKSSKIHFSSLKFVLIYFHLFSVNHGLGGAGREGLEGA
jgi:hypothetical protein